MALIENGFVKISRNIFNSSLMDKPAYYFKLWFWMICRANFKEKVVKGTRFRRGELIATYEEMRSVCAYYKGYVPIKVSKSMIEDCLKWMRTEHMITTRKTTKGLIIYIDKYDFYQNGDNYEDHKEGNKYHTDAVHNPDNINKNDKNEKELITGRSPEIKSSRGFEHVSRSLGAEYRKKVAQIEAKAITQWQEKAIRYATDLGIELNSVYESRWYKVFKQAHEGRKVSNLEKAYRYLIDHPKNMNSDGKIQMFFKVYENG